MATNTASRPVTFLLVPGGFCPPTVYTPLATALRKRHTVELVSLPSVGRKPGPAPSLHDDAAHVRALAQRHMSAGHDVVIVGNSYGGAVITQAPEGKVYNDNPSHGKLIHLVYLASMLGTLHMTIAADLEGKQPMPTSSWDGSDWLQPGSPEMMGALLVPQQSPAEQARIGAMCVEHSVASFHDKLTFEWWKYVPTTMVVAGRDKAFDRKWQEESVDAVMESGESWAGHARKVVVEEGDHFVWLGKGEGEVLGVLDGIAERWRTV